MKKLIFLKNKFINQKMKIKYRKNKVIFKISNKIK